MSTGTNTREITLADWLTAIGAVAVGPTEGGYSATALLRPGGYFGVTPEDALQALAEATLDEGTLLDSREEESEVPDAPRH